MPYSRTVRAAVRKGLGFSPTNEYLDEAMRQYGAWHLPTLKIEAEDTKAKLMACNPEGGAAWLIYHRMNAAVLVRETMAKQG